MKPFLKEFRGTLLAACDRWRSTCRVATLFNVSESWVRRVERERQELNRVGGRPEAARSRASVPHGHWKRTTLLAALRTTGLTAPLVMNGAINGEIFLSQARRHLVPTLQPGDVVVMNNIGVHKVAGVCETIAAAGARVIYLPPYSPDFNPIALVFPKFKWLLKRVSARTVEAVWSVCGEVLDRFTEMECRKCFQHCGRRYT